MPTPPNALRPPDVAPRAAVRTPPSRTAPVPGADPPPRRPRAGRVQRDDVCVAAGVAANALVALCSHHFPYQDAPNHLARYVLMARFWSGQRPANVDVRLVPDSYIGVDLIGVALVRALGPDGAHKALAVAALTALPLGLYLLLRRVAPAQRGWALAGVVLSLSWFVIAGMLTYTIGVGLALAWIAAWWPRRRDARPGAALALALGAAALVPVHLAAALLVLVVAWVNLALAAFAAFAAAWPRVRPAALLRLPELPTVAAASLAVATFVATERWSEAGTAGGVVLRSAAGKLAALGSPFYSVSLAQAAVGAAAYAVVLGAFAYVNRARLRLADPFMLSAFAFFALFLVFPKEASGATAVDARWLMPMYLLPFCAAGARAPRPSAAVLGVALAACLAHAGTVWVATREFDRRLDEYDAALRLVPAGSRLLPLISDQGRYPRVGPYQQYAHWFAIRAGGQVPGLWSFVGTREGEPLIPHLRHFSVRQLRYYPPHTWGATRFEPLDWARIAREYDYIVQYSDAASVTAYVAAHAREVGRAGRMRVFRVVPVAPPAGVRP